MRTKALILALWTAVLVVVDNYLIAPLWGQIAFTALTAIPMAYALDRVGTSRSA
ncbi:hypothetical protein [Streptomyces sp. NPDC020607]|uniref:hypothetical protein n=1 Tax=Streptomyces sp. NPDC020607 TaxID=3365082 RepID=UPI0037BBBBDD